MSDSTSQPATSTTALEETRGTDRRDFLKQGAFAVGGAAVGVHAGTRRPTRRTSAKRRPPNILVIVVDQVRTPVWMPALAPQSSITPHLWKLRSSSVSFENHYTASNDCSPSRGVLLTGLYTHQTGVMITGDSWLDPRFPTWGTLLRQMGYTTAYYGKWHLHPNAYAPMEQYGFDGGTYPSPNGSPGQGTQVDPYIARQVTQWLKANAGREPWCATASFVNPHDIAWWWRYTSGINAEASPPSYATALPPNFETPQEMIERRKPALQRSLQDTAAEAFGPVPFEGPEVLPMWLNMMNTYLLLQSYVDAQIGNVLTALRAHPKVAANTVVVFTSDHGEYGGSHGLRGKGGAVYEEGVHVPLLVKDLRGGEKLCAAPKRRRTGLSSSVDVAPLLLSIATESESWRKDPHYSHIASRHDMLAMLQKPQAPGRTHILHATDEIVTEYAIKPYAADAPLHLSAIRTPKAKLALYSNWTPGTAQIATAGQEAELYDYRTVGGRQETENMIGLEDSLEAELRARLRLSAAEELHEPLPRRLHNAQRAGFADYFDTASDAVIGASRRRERMLEQIAEGRKLGFGLHQMLHRERYGYHGHPGRYRHRGQRLFGKR
jgi:arylsulfatase A-like enzyme